MPTYEVEMNGKSYEVDAPSIEAFSQAYQSQGQNAQGDFFHPVKPAPGSGLKGVLERISQYPRIALGEIGDAFHTLGRVAHGEIDATSPDAIKASTNLASVMSPAGEFSGTGAQIARRAFSPGQANPGFAAPSAGMAAAQAAADIGSPLPAGIVSNTPGMQQFTQGFRQMPFVGSAITHKVGKTVEAAGNKVGDIAEELSGGPVADRATVGANTRQSLQDVIEANNTAIDQSYNDLRNNHIDANGASDLPNTKATLAAIKRERQAAGMTNPSAGIGDIENLASADRSFNGLVRARSDVGQMVRASKDNPNPGFVPGDFKRVYGAMTRDLENVVRSNPQPGVNPDDAVEAFRFANGQAQHLIERNGAIQKLLNNSGDEGLLGKIINNTREKGGNAQVLGELRTQMPPEDFEKISGIVINELGHNPATGEFSLNQFASNWNKMGDTAKSIVIADPSHRKTLDAMSELGTFLKKAEQYQNKSNTGHAVGLVGLLAALQHTGGDPHELALLAGALTGGYGLSKILARPASASALRRWTEAAAKKQQIEGRYGSTRAAGARAALTIATRNLLNNLPGTDSEPSSTRQPRTTVTVHPLPEKVQGRVSSP